MKQNVTFGEYINNKRLEMNISFGELRDYLGCNCSTLTKYIGNKMFPSEQRMSLLSSVLEINPVYLYSLTRKVHPDLKWKIITLTRDDPKRFEEDINRLFDEYTERPSD